MFLDRTSNRRKDMPQPLQLPLVFLHCIWAHCSSCIDGHTSIMSRRRFCSSCVRLQSLTVHGSHSEVPLFRPIVKSSNQTILEQKTGWVLDVNSTLADGSTNMNVLLIVGHALLQKQNRHNAMFCVASVTKSPAIQPIDLFVACGRLIFPSVAGGSFGEDAM